MAYFAGMVILTYLCALTAKMSPIRKRGVIGQYIPNPFGFVIPAVLFALFSGYRNNVGDTFFYMYSFDLLDIDKPVEFAFKGSALFDFFQYRLKLHTDDAQHLILITAAVFCIPAVYTLYHYADPYELGIYLFVTTSYYTVSMNGIRQYMATAFILLGTKYIFSPRNTDFFKYLALVIAAWLLHSSALIMIPIYFIVRRRAWAPITMLLLAGTVFATLVFDRILPSFLSAIEDTEFGIYDEVGWFTSGTERGASFMRVLVLLVPLALAYMSRERIADALGRPGDIIINLSIINLLFYILALYNWIFARLAIYTGIYAIILITWLVAHGYEKEDGQKVYWGSILMYAVNFYNLKYTVDGYRSDYF